MIFSAISMLLFVLLQKKIGDSEHEGGLKIDHCLVIMGFLMYYLGALSSMKYVKQVVKLFCEQNIYSEDRATAVDIIEKNYSNAVGIASTLIESGGKIDSIFSTHAKVICELTNLQPTQSNIDFFTFTLAGYFNHISDATKVWGS